MEIKEFTNKVRRAIEKELGEEYRVEIKEVTKNNGSLLQGLLIISKEENLIPTIYLDSFYEAYEKGMSLSEIVSKILRLYRESKPNGQHDMDYFRNYESVKDRICYRLINREANRELLKDVPFVEYLDLAICFFYAFQDETIGDGSILIYNSHLETWNVTAADLLWAAERNTPRLFPADLRPLGDVLREMCDIEIEDVPALEIPLAVLSNHKKLCGANCMLYPKLLDEHATRRGRSFYIIPSSIHEVLMIDADGRQTAESLKEMIAEVNNTHVAKEDILSYNLYYYDFETKSVRLA